LPRYSCLYRVFPWVDTAEPGEPGHPLYVAGPQGHGRVDNPEQYLTLYASDHAEGAIGEAFGNHSLWTRDLLQGPPALSGSERALAVFGAGELDVVDLDDPAALLERRLRPSEVVTRVRSVTQEWALAIFREARWSGVRWWSYYDAGWGSFGLWDPSDLRLEEVRPLRDEVDNVREVAARMRRVWED
jgi:hypothetical protein